MQTTQEPCDSPLQRVRAWGTSVIVWGITSALSFGACNALDEMGESKPLPEKKVGQIPSTAFVFAEITEPDKKGGGWWTGCLHLHLQRDPDDKDEDRPMRVTCTLEFGFPIVTQEQGRISKRLAQQVAADVTNEAKAKVALTGRMTSEICGELKKTVIRMANDKIEGTRIMGKCSTQGQVPEFSWP